ncbi:MULTISPECIES: TetR/AcrR family transcriptional regulator [Staphylococcus]|uniref:TetR/AcrR family transcriptional regulator n=1 Tax=Staphylococcus haemolyticus TaxID=1283 RepID=A0A2K0AY90_STAHA|nr:MULTISPECIES: TetR/AcrR family transcriptional regulator [Staphylococcus]MBY6179736.1 TetR/AcrR family transcriptional regulator [Staphylococcaceae bacterium DP2N0-1]OFK32234.1 TetR family transcriptional regulator [Staphylococcus sp. HMSC065C10]OFM39205.1 TetR family transcriptional regulator [Staphylococcus sp. HMSC076B11]OFP30390.1 TetR family transcriptional regulator [Staphylococcus sp. HMSC068H08]OFP89309.1 TetR family transcriptional regulator [Staphylococcus sp. HMSC072D04]OHP72384
MNKQDLRVQKTHQALITSFSDLLQTKSFEQITVQDLCANANVRRSTFYRHFNDKYDLLNHVVGTLIDHFRKLYLPDINPDNPRQFFEKLMRDVLTFIHDNKDIVRSVITLNFYGEVYTIFYEQIYKAVQKQIEFDRQSGQFYVDVTIYGEFLTGGILSVITNWIQHGQQQSIDKVTKEIVNMICGAREVHLKKLS